MDDITQIADFLSPEILSASMVDEQYISAGLNNRVWRINNLAVERDYIIRVSKDRQDLFTDPDTPPQPQPLTLQTLGAYAAQPIIGFFAKDPDKNTEVQVADIQLELKGDFLGLTIPERNSRTKKIIEIRTEDEVKDTGWGSSKTYPVGSEKITTEPDYKEIERTNEYLFKLGERVANMPLSFYAQFIKDVLEIEEAGYEIDPSKPQNFCIMHGLNRVGFCDLSPTQGVKLTPSDLATILWQPANETWHPDQSDTEKEYADDLKSRITRNVIMVCDQLGIAFAPVYTDPRIYSSDKETPIREKYDLSKPDQLLPIILNDNNRPTGHGLKSSDIDISKFCNNYGPNRTLSQHI